MSPNDEEVVHRYIPSGTEPNLFEGVLAKGTRSDGREHLDNLHE